ncbi:MAG: polyphosphate kinase 1 [Planctomycetota bacterium]
MSRDTSKSDEESSSAIDPEALPMPPEERYTNRDLSWLEFNRRVLAQAADTGLPLLERVKFLAIFSSNLDEFFQKRVGLLRGRIAAGVARPKPDGLTPQHVLSSIRDVVVELQEEQARLWHDEVSPALAKAGIHIVRHDDLSEDEREQLGDYFRINVFPILTPLSVDPGHRFPFISNLSENLGVIVTPPGSEERSFARIKIPDVLSRFIRVPGDDDPNVTKLLPLDELIVNNLDDLFPGLDVRSVTPFRITRNAAIELDEDEDVDDLLQHVEAELHLRRFAKAVRLEVQPEHADDVVEFVADELGLADEDIYERRGPLEYTDLFQLADLERPDLKHTPWVPVVPQVLAAPLDAPPAMADPDIFAVIRERDVLLHHPYDSFTATVERFVAAAARDPDVLAIKQTIYRTSRDSPFVASMIRAAEAGKQVACLVELRARFDESANVRFARQLEKHGVHVAYGVIGLKTHCKCSLVVRREGSGLRCYAHLGTGNYHSKTAQLYTDLGLLTCNPAITDDVVSLFNLLTGRSQQTEYNELLVAPTTMRARFNKLIDREIKNAQKGRPARIVAKFNSFEDRRIADRLYAASRAGVQITLIVRGFCCVRPGVPGLSDNIRVISVIGRFLEHSRIFHFADGEEAPENGVWLMGSADWMYRNLNNRVESIVPVHDASAKRRLARIIEVMVRDHRNAWDLQHDGSYIQRFPPNGAEPDSPEAAGTFETLMHETRS